MSALTAEQREALLKVVERRLRKLDDEALLQVERLTRKPEKVRSFQAVSSPGGGRQESGAARRRATLESLLDAPGGQISRRQLLTGGGAAVLLGGTSYALGTRQKQKAITEMHERLSGMMRALEPGIRELGDAAIEVGQQSRRIHEAATDFGDRYPALRDALESWNVVVRQLGAQYGLMRNLVGDIQWFTRKLAQMADRVRAGIKIPIIGTIQVFNGEQDATALTSAADLLESLPEALDASERLRRQLAHWISDDATIDVDDRLLRPLEDTFCDQVGDLASKCRAFERDWRAELVEPFKRMSETDS